MSIGKYFWRPIDLIGCLIFGPFFVGGWSTEGVLKKGAKLKKQGYKVTYDLLGEHIASSDKVFDSMTKTLELIDKMDSSNKGNVAIKPTLYGLEISKELFYEVTKHIVECAMEKGIEVEFDAEMRSVIPDTFEVFNSFARKFPHRNFVRQCVQAHLIDILDRMDEYELWDKQLRVVKGAGVYDEPESVVLQDVDKIIEQYRTIAERNYSEEGQVPYIATMRDKDIPAMARGLSPKSYIRPYRPVIQMLYGPRGKSLRKKLLEEGKDVRIYIPFVASPTDFSWFSYGLRRAAMMRRLFFKFLK